VLAGDVAQADPADQALITRLDHGGELIVEPLAGRRAVGQPQVDRGELVHAEGAQDVLDPAAQLRGLAVGQPAAGSVPARPDFADQREGAGVGGQRRPDELVGDAGPVALRGVDVVHAELGAPPNTPRPGSCIAPNPMRDTEKPPRRYRCMGRF